MKSRFDAVSDAARARAHAAAQQLSDRPLSGILEDTIQTLEQSPWPHHNIEAGWLCLQGYLQLRRKLAGDQTLPNRAHDIWQNVAQQPNINPRETLRAQTALIHLPLWRRVKTGNYMWNNREKQRHLQRTQKLHEAAIDLLDSYPKKRSIIVGAMSEIIIADVLNRLHISQGSHDAALPAQSWYDLNPARHCANFDLWRTHTIQPWQKIQAKTRTYQAELPENQNYDPDIVVVYLEDHWPDQPVGAISAHLSHAPLDDESALAAATSIEQKLRIADQQLIDDVA